MEALARSRKDVVLRIVDIDTWQSEVARQHGIRSIPHLVLFVDGRRSVEGTEAVLAALSE